MNVQMAKGSELLLEAASEYDTIDTGGTRLMDMA